MEHTDIRSPSQVWSGQLCSLRPLLPTHEPLLYEAALDPAISHSWRYRGRNVSPEEFHLSLHDGVLSQFIAEGRSGTPAAHLMSYDFDPNARHAQIGVQSLGNPRPGIVGEAVYLFVSYLFSRFNLNKVYLDMTESNRSLVATFDFVRCEVVHRDHYYLNGEWVGRLVHAVYRRDWDRFLLETRATVGGLLPES